MAASCWNWDLSPLELIKLSFNQNLAYYSCGNRRLISVCTVYGHNTFVHNENCIHTYKFYDKRSKLVKGFKVKLVGLNLDNYGKVENGDFEFSNNKFTLKHSNLNKYFCQALLQMDSTF